MEIINKIVFDPHEIEKIKILIASAMLEAKDVSNCIYRADMKNKIYNANKYLDAAWNMLGG